MLLLALYCTYCTPTPFLYTLHSSQFMLWGLKRAMSGYLVIVRPYDCPSFMIVLIMNGKLRVQGGKERMSHAVRMSQALVDGHACLARTRGHADRVWPIIRCEAIKRSDDHKTRHLETIIRSFGLWSSDYHNLTDDWDVDDCLMADCLIVLTDPLDAC